MTNAQDPAFQTLRLERRDRILTIIFDRPEQMNAVNSELHEEMARVFRYAAADPRSDIIVLTGSGRAFSAGGDIPWMQKGIDDPALFRVFSMLDCEKPIIAKVNGAAAGLGANVALLCDVIFMASDAIIVDPHVKVGLVAADGGALIWPQLIGFARAKHYLMTGEPVRAPEALAMGLVNFVVERAQLDAAVDAYVDKLAAGATLAIRWTKTTINIALKQLAHSMMDAGLAYEALSNSTADHQEGVTGFVERRPARFTGK